MTKKRFVTYTEIEIPKDEDLHYSKDLERILEDELKNKNVVCLSMALILAIKLSSIVSAKSELIEDLLKSFEFINSPIFTSALIIPIYLLIFKITKTSSEFGLYEIKKVKKQRRVFIFFTISKWLASIFSITAYTIFSYMRIIILDKNHYRVNAIIIAVLSLGIPHILTEKLAYLPPAQLINLNLQLCEYILIFPISLLLVVLGQRILFNSLFQGLEYTDKLTSLTEIRDKITEIINYYKNNFKIESHEFTLIVKGASTTASFYLFKICLNFLIKLRTNYPFLDKTCLLISQIIITTKNIGTWVLINYSSLLLLLVEIVLGLGGIYFIKEFVFQSVNLYRSINSNDPLNITIYYEIFSILSYLFCSTLLSFSVFKSSLYKKNLRRALKIMKQNNIKRLIELEKRKENSASNPLRRKIGLVK